MTNSTCSVCERKHYARGLCKAHYRRVIDGRGLNPDKPLRNLPAADERDDIASRILSKTEPTASGCLEFTGVLNENGYGQISWHAKHWLTHRAMWTVLNGELPAWPMVIDHLCRNRACVNVEHMEVVHQGENAERGGGRHVADAVRFERNAHRTTCRFGHDRDQHEHCTPGGYVYCRACRGERHLQRKSRTAKELA